jgi:hypothetical protein
MTEVKMYKVFIALTLSIFLPFVSFAQNGHSPYAGQEKREIKALSLEDIEGLLEGHGMGLAKPAELNHYPGPKHVLELAKGLHLSKDQLESTREIYDAMHKEAVWLGRKIVERERSLDNLFANHKIDQKSLSDMSIEIGKLQGQLRAVHLKAHLEMKTILSSQQIDRYDELRGYQGKRGKQIHHHKNHS